MKANTVSTLMLACELKRRMESQIGLQEPLLVSIEECNRRIAFWSREALKRIFLFAADPRQELADRILDAFERGQAKLAENSGNEKQIEVIENDELIIPVGQTEEIAPGVFQVKPNDVFREWVKRQAAIKIA